MIDEDTLAEWQRAARPGWAWAWPIAIALGMLWTIAPRAEAWMWPVFGQQEMGEVTRDDQKLCWMRVSEKFRAPEVQNYDVFLDRMSTVSDRMIHSFPEIFSEAPPHAPVSTDRAPGIGWARRRLCIQLPPDVTLGQPIRLRQVIHFRGFLGLWDVPVTLPTIMNPSTEPPH